MDAAGMKNLASIVKENVNRVIVGNGEVIERLIIAMICSGHVLLEDVPGVGKTLMVKTLAKSMDCTFKRVQFTPDLLPSDVTGIHYYNQKTGEFTFRPGPLFCNVLLADEINRATPRTQSSLLECMEERQITIDGETRRLERPFLVIATQNPVESHGTFPLPEAQLDRFFMKLSLGYPTREEQLDILLRFKEDEPLEQIEPVIGAKEIIAMQDAYRKVHADQDLLQYIVAIAEATREHPDTSLGVSPRGCQALLRAAQASAVLDGRDYVVPDDVKRLAVSVLAHRLVLNQKFKAKEDAAAAVITNVLKQVSVPQEQVAQR